MENRRISERRISPAVTEFMANKEIERLRALNAELVGALQSLMNCITETRGPNADKALQQANSAIAKATKS